MWAINGISLATAGLTISGGSFRTGAASEMSLRAARAFDAEPLFAEGTAVTITRGGSVFFQGKVRVVPISAEGGDESHGLRVVDAWQDLEDTTYHEPWAAGAGSVMLPFGFLGVNPEGQPITTGQQIRDAIAYAVAAGITIQAGSIPDGLPLWPYEVRNVTIAEVIRQSMRYHPDWVPWIDHTTTPPTLHVHPRAELAERAIAVDGTGDVSGLPSVVKRVDMVPAAVRITYLTASIIDGVTYRAGVIDQYPPDGPTAGPRVISVCIELAGGQMQFQKSRIQTRPIPDSQAEAKEWLIEKYPHLADVDPDHFTVTGWVKSLVEEDAELLPPPVNPRATRLEVEDATDLPRELVRGTVEDWMRRKVGRVRIAAAVKPVDDATAAEKAALAKPLPPVTIVATDAVTKVYRGVTHFQAPEAAPEGIAQALYEALTPPQYEGAVTLTQVEVPATRFHGCRLNFIGGAAGWSTMNAMIHSVTYDIDQGITTLDFGLSPFLGAEDLLELQRLLRSREPTWIFEDERTSNELGSDTHPGSKGDTVSGFDQPETIFEQAATGESSTIVPARFDPPDGEDGWMVTFTQAKLWEHSLHRAGFGHPIKAGDGEFLDSDPAPALPLEEGENGVWLKYGIEHQGRVKADTAELVIGDAPEGAPVLPTRPAGGSTDGVHVQRIGTITVDGDGPPLWEPVAPHATANIFLPGIQNAGDGVPLYNTFDALAKADKLKSLKNTTGDGQPLVIEHEAESVFIARVKQRADSSEDGYPQIKVVTVGDTPTSKQVEIQGNGIKIDASGRITGVRVRDGLVTGVDAEAPEDGDGDNFNIRRLNVGLSVSGSEIAVSLPSGDIGPDIFVRNGLCHLTDPDGANVPNLQWIARVQNDGPTTSESGPGWFPAEDEEEE